jgi:hypothetical protein
MYWNDAFLRSVTISLYRTAPPYSILNDDAVHVQEFEEDLAAAEVKEEGGAEGGADAAGLGHKTKQYVVRKLYTSGGDIPQM